MSTTPQNDKSCYHPLIGEIRHQRSSYPHGDESHHQRRLRQNVIQRDKESKSRNQISHVSKCTQDGPESVMERTLALI